MSNDCKDTLQTQNKTVWVWRSRTSKVSIRYRRRQSCQNRESFRRTVPSSADAWKTPVKITMWEMCGRILLLFTYLLSMLYNRTDRFDMFHITAYHYQCSPVSTSISYEADSPAETNTVKISTASRNILRAHSIWYIH